MNKTYLNKFHQENNGHLVDFAGWEMPINYGSQINEHNTVYKVYSIKGEPINKLFYKSEKRFAWSAGLFIWAYNKLFA